MITEAELNKVFDQAVRSFIVKEIERKSLAYKIADVKVFDMGSKLVVEREGEPPIEIETKEYSASAILRNEYVRSSDFDMVRAFFETLATRMADQQTQAMIKEMHDKAGLRIDARGDILGGLIEAAKQMREKGHVSEKIIIANPEILGKLRKALEEDPKRAKLLKELLSGKA